MSSEARDKRRAELSEIYSKFKKDRCEECGVQRGGHYVGDYWVKGRDWKLTVHHIDEDIENNDSSNLQTLCRKCHDRKHSSH